MISLVFIVSLSHFYRITGVKIFNVTGNLTVQSLGGTVMKSVSKTITITTSGSANTVDTGLTKSQLAGLYSVYVDSSTHSNIKVGSVAYAATHDNSGDIIVGIYRSGGTNYLYINGSGRLQASSNYTGTFGLTFYYFE